MTPVLPLTLVLAGAPASSGGSVHAQHAQTRPSPAHAAPRVLDDPAQTGAFTAWVYGYYAYWAGTVQDLPWDRLTHVAIFDVGLTASGGLSGTAHWTDVADEAIALGRPYGVKVHLAVTSFDDATMAAVLGDPGLRAAAAEALATLVDDHGGHGVAVDFEGMNAGNSADLVEFVTLLASMVDEVTVATPAVDWNGAYDYDALAAASDGLFIMGYDYHWKGGDPGPVAPLFGGPPWGMYALDWTVADYLQWGTPADKIILGLPLYGYSWPSTSTTVPGNATANATSVLFADAVVAAEVHGRQWDETTKTPYYFPSGNEQTFYDDTESLDHKIGWALQQGVRGVGFWAVNYEAGDPDLWDMVASHTQVIDEPDTTGDEGGGDDTAGDSDPTGGEAGSTTSAPASSDADEGDGEDAIDPGGGTDSTGDPIAEDAADEAGCSCRVQARGREGVLFGLVLVALRMTRSPRSRRGH